jgi:4-hydroxy-tetrahydrodipicolinate synthase
MQRHRAQAGADHRIVGIKEATGNIERAAWLIKQAPPGLSISGDDGTAVA